MNAALPVETLVTDHLDLWTTALKRKSTAGRGSSSKVELYGIKKLRELILELAVRGLLVPQDPNDEPASELLKRIAAEKVRLVKAKTIRNSRPLAPISDEEKFMSLPAGWVFARLNDIGDWGAGATPSRNNPELYGGSIPWFKSGELVADYISHSEETVTELALTKASLRYNKVGDVLIAMYGATIGKTAILSVPATTNQAVCACTPFPGFEKTYLLTLLKAYKPRFVGMGAGGAQPNISREKIIETVVAVPPTSEQHRIVAKVDELMALCDQLEQETEASLGAHQTLVETLLSALTSAADHAQFASAWQRIAGHFDTLFTTEESIAQLKQTLLQLAVMGKLVPQDPNDEPASELLKRIAAEKATLVKEGKIKKDKPLLPISDNEVPFELPDGWAFCRLQEAIDVRDGTHDSPKDAAGAKTYPLVTSKNFINAGIDFDSARRISEEDHLEISKRSLVEVDDILFSMIGGNIGNQVMVCDSRPFSVKNVALFKYFLKSATYPRFFYLYTQELAAELQNQASGGAQPFVALGYLRNLVLALPPIAEQYRIVAKVDELMALCDQLKSRLSDAQTTRLHLADALVERAIG